MPVPLIVRIYQYTAGTAHLTNHNTRQRNNEKQGVATVMGARRHGQGDICSPLPSGNVEKCFCCKCCLKPQQTKYLCIILRKCRLFWGPRPPSPSPHTVSSVILHCQPDTKPLGPAGGFPSFRPSYYSPLEKITRAPSHAYTGTTNMYVVVNTLYDSVNATANTYVNRTA